MADSQDRAYLQDSQYRTSDHLTARADLHRRFTVSPFEWHSWVLTQLAIQPGEAVLECGAGPGWLWAAAEALPEGSSLALTDLSAGMMNEATLRLDHAGNRVTLTTADIQTLPFPDDAFDVVVANHMLYHVPDIPRALTEIARVLRRNGRFAAATNGVGHMRELFDLGLMLFPGAPNDLRVAMRSLPFALENGADLLGEVFGQVDLHRYDSYLEVDDASALIDYMLSSAESAAFVSPSQRSSAVNQVARQLAVEGPLRISKETGLFIARSPFKNA